MMILLVHRRLRTDNGSVWQDAPCDQSAVRQALEEQAAILANPAADLDDSTSMMYGLALYDVV